MGSYQKMNFSFLYLQITLSIRYKRQKTNIKIRKSQQIKCQRILYNEISLYSTLIDKQKNEIAPIQYGYYLSKRMSSNQFEIRGEDTPENSQKGTKLARFLATIDSEIMREIQNYLATNIQKPRHNSKKPDRVLLHHDLLIIHLFKENQSMLNKKGKVKQLCYRLQKQLNLSIATIQERIQKKIANITTDDLMEHVRIKKDLAFDVRKKLVMPNKNHIPKGQNTTIASNQDKNSSHKKQIMFSQNKSYHSESNEQQSKQREKQRQKQLLEARIRFKNKISVKYQEQQLEEEYIEYDNDFNNISDHSDDEEVIYIVDKKCTRISSLQVESMQKEIRQKVKKIYSKFSGRQIITQENIIQHIHSISHPDIDNENHEPNTAKNTSVLPEKNQPQQEVSMKIDSRDSLNSLSKKTKKIKSQKVNKSKQKKEEMYPLPEVVEKDQATLDSYFKKYFNNSKKNSQSNLGLEDKSHVIDLQEEPVRSDKIKQVVDIDQSKSNNQIIEIQEQLQLNGQKQGNMQQEIWYEEQDQFLKQAIATNNPDNLSIIRRYREPENIIRRAIKLGLQVGQLKIMIGQ